MADKKKYDVSSNIKKVVNNIDLNDDLGFYGYIDNVKKHWIPLSEKIGISNSIAKAQLDNFLVPSLQNIGQKWEGYYSDNKSASDALNFSVKQCQKEQKDSSAESVHKETVDQASSDAKDGDKTKGWLLSTSAEEPDFEHALLEGEVLSADEVLELVDRFGCRHSFELW